MSERKSPITPVATQRIREEAETQPTLAARSRAGVEAVDKHHTPLLIQSVSRLPAREGALENRFIQQTHENGPRNYHDVVETKDSFHPEWKDKNKTKTTRESQEERMGRKDCKQNKVVCKKKIVSFKNSAKCHRIEICAARVHADTNLRSQLSVGQFQGTPEPSPAVALAPSDATVKTVALSHGAATSRKRADQAGGSKTPRRLGVGDCQENNRDQTIRTERYEWINKIKCIITRSAPYSGEDAGLWNQAAATDDELVTMHNHTGLHDECHFLTSNLSYAPLLCPSTLASCLPDNGAVNHRAKASGADMDPRAWACGLA
ncbi:hypothetical protein QQS21_003729 [Conoideocrella luteorostrata]|uniref:Uncharacterized protein n=1 Tax=Conoideocrella luteorostrata TaxID=1105319 RepID=A0AAJ0CVA2_9HYPO|nr:hypothetical protein QQS21_003729 [Conoideocrella luteorostrata]